MCSLKPGATALAAPQRAQRGPKIEAVVPEPREAKEASKVEAQRTEADAYG